MIYDIKQIIREALELKIPDYVDEDALEPHLQEIVFERGGYLSYAIVNNEFKPDKKGNIIYITGVIAPRDSNFNLIKGTGTIKTALGYLKDKYKNYYVSGTPISNTAVKIFANELNIKTERNKIFLTKLK
jgi:hypothetical protein